MTDELRIQNLGCKVTAESGHGKIDVPVCLGGTVIRGCNGDRDCMQTYFERMRDQKGMQVESIGVDVKSGLVVVATFSPLEESSGQLIVTPCLGPDIIA